MIGPRAKLLLLAAFFALPIVASFLAYRFMQPAPNANYGELLLPPAQITTQPLAGEGGKPFSFARLAGSWVLVVSDASACVEACARKVAALSQVRLALGREAGRVQRVFVAEDGRVPDAKSRPEFEGMVLAAKPAGVTLPAGPGADRDHVYLVDPRGNVMMRWPAAPDRKRMYKDLQRLLKASQIG